MLGQFFELCPIGALAAGALLVCAGAVVEELPLVVVLELAAFAIAAPPPTSAPVTASVVNMAFRLVSGFHLLVSPVDTMHGLRLNHVGDE